MAHIFAILSDIIMTLTWKIEKHCKYSDWKKTWGKLFTFFSAQFCGLQRRLGWTSHCGFQWRPFLWIVHSIFLTLTLRSNTHQRKLKIQCFHTEVVSLKESQWRTSLQDHEMLHPIPHWGLQGKVQVLLYRVLIYEAKYFPDEFQVLVSSFLKERCL